MKTITLLLLAFFALSCNSNDDADDGLCWGSIRDEAEDGTVYHDVRFKWDCVSCGYRVTRYCPEDENCEYQSATGIFVCD